MGGLGTDRSYMKVLSAIAQILIAIALFALAGVIFTYQPQVNKYLELKARADCAQAYKTEFEGVGTNTKVTSPIPEEFQKCLQEAMGN